MRQPKKITLRPVAKPAQVLLEPPAWLLRFRAQCKAIAFKLELMAEEQAWLDEQALFDEARRKELRIEHLMSRAMIISPAPILLISAAW